jgi:hypothetical protein
MSERLPCDLHSTAGRARQVTGGHCAVVRNARVSVGWHEAAVAILRQLHEWLPVASLGNAEYNVGARTFEVMRGQHFRFHAAVSTAGQPSTDGQKNIMPSSVERMLTVNVQTLLYYKV